MSWIEKIVLGKSSKRTRKEYDPTVQKPVLRRSICTGETTAGFKDLTTGKYTEILLIQSSSDVDQFMKDYGITERPDTEY